MSIKSLNNEKNLIINITKFTIPLILTNVLQQMYNIIDHMIAGNFAGEMTLAAIGATSHLTTLLIQLLIGISVGVSAVVAQTIGENDEETIKKTVHTSMATGVWGGIIVSIIGVVFCRPLLILLNTPEAILGQAAEYMTIIFGGYITASIYNFGAAILRARGDTKSPLYFLFISGITKIILTFLFVAVFKLGIKAIAVSTIISQALSAVLALYSLSHQEERFRLYFRKIKIYRSELIRVLKMGVPIGLQTSMFPISNVIIQSSINSFGELAVAGTAAAGHINSILYAILTSMSHSSTIFCSQNFGAKKYKELLKSLYVCLGLVLVVGLVCGGISHILTVPIIDLFVDDKVAIKYGVDMAKMICLTYFLNGAQEAVGGGLRAINKSTVAMLSATFGLCAVRILWVYTYFASHKSIGVLYFSYPLSWVVTLVISSILFAFYFKKIDKQV